jgi:hypothetical protein
MRTPVFCGHVPVFVMMGAPEEPALLKNHSRRNRCLVEESWFFMSVGVPEEPAP